MAPQSEPTEMKYESSSPPREIAPGLMLQVPGTLTAAITLGGVACQVSMQLDSTERGVRPVSVTVTPVRPGQPLTSVAVRSLRLAELTRDGIYMAARRTRTRKTADGGLDITVLSPRLDERDIELIRRRGPVPEGLQAVAEIYNVAAICGLPPAAQVQRELEMPASTAANWIKRAREAGLITRGA